MRKPNIDIIWNISLVCPWDCEFCCTDAIHVTKKNNSITSKENSLETERLINDDCLGFFCEKYPNIIPNKFDLALVDRQKRGIEPSYKDKITIINTFKDLNVNIDFAGGDPLACYENFLVIKEASRILGKESISITSTGLIGNRYNLLELSSIIGEFEFTYDEPSDMKEHNRPKGYSYINLSFAKKMSELGVKTKAQLPIHTGNLSKVKIASIYKDLCESGINELLLMRTFPVGRGGKHLNKKSISKDNILFVINEFKRIARNDGTKIRLQCALKHLEDNKPSTNPCDLMSHSFGINFEGKLLISAWANGSNGYPISDDFILGDLKESSFKQISNSEKFLRYKEKLDLNFGHCKIFSYIYGHQTNEAALFSKTDPLYSKNIFLKHI